MFAQSEKELCTTNFLLPNKLIFKKYKILRLISDRSFYQIYLVINEKTKKCYSMKIENKNSICNILEQEAYHLYEIKGTGIPEFITFGKMGNHKILIQELLGKSLYELFADNDFKFSIKDICLISIQLIDRIELIHSKTLIHRDIKPENLFIGLENPNIIYITKFGFCSKFCSSKTGKHITPGFKGTFTGTLKFSSANAQRGNRQSRRDDIESLGYTILFFMKGKLPWQNLNQKYNEKEIYLKTYAMKKFMPIERLCKGLPSNIEDFFKYIRTLKFTEEPNYEYLRNIFKNILKDNGCENYQKLNLSWVDNNFQGIGQKEKRSKTLTPKTRLYLKIKRNIQLNKDIEFENSLKKENISNIKKIEIDKNQLNQSPSLTKLESKDINLKKKKFFNFPKRNRERFISNNCGNNKAKKEKDNSEQIEKLLEEHHLKNGQNNNSNYLNINNKNENENKYNNFIKINNYNLNRKKLENHGIKDLMKRNNYNSNIYNNRIKSLNSNQIKNHLYSNSNYLTDDSQFSYQKVNKSPTTIKQNNIIYFQRPLYLKNYEINNINFMGQDKFLVNLNNNKRSYVNNDKYFLVDNNKKIKQNFINNSANDNKNMNISRSEKYNNLINENLNNNNNNY